MSSYFDSSSIVDNVRCHDSCANGITQCYQIKHLSVFNIVWHSVDKNFFLQENRPAKQKRAKVVVCQYLDKAVNIFYFKQFGVYLLKKTCIKELKDILRRNSLLTISPKSRTLRHKPHVLIGDHHNRRETTRSLYFAQRSLRVIITVYWKQIAVHDLEVN